MKTVQFLGPTAVLVVGDKRIERGGSDVVSDQEAARLKKWKHIEVKVSDAPVADPSPAPASVEAIAPQKEE